MAFTDFPTEYSYLKEEETDKLLKFRFKEINDTTSAKDWIEKFSVSTKTTWRVARTYPKSGRINVFKLDLKCQHATDKRAQGIGPSKNTDCPAILRITVKKVLENSHSAAHLLIKEWPTICSLQRNHNHAIESAAVLQYRDLSEDSKEKLCALFRKGHSPSSALHCLKTDFLLQYGDDYYKIAADGYYIPSLSIASKIFSKEFSAIYGNIDGTPMLDSLEKFLQEYSSSNGKAEFSKTADGKNYFVVLLTPIMLRSHEIKQSEEVVLVDASGGVDKQRHRIYFIVTPTAAGGLPLGVVITDSENEKVFFEALERLKIMLGDKAFNGKGYPKVFLTDNDLKERNPIRKHFPESKLLLCQFHILKAVWSWLCGKQNGIDVKDRQEIYFYIKNMIYAQNEEKFLEKKELLISSQLFTKYERLAKYFAYIWELRFEWASCFRHDLPLRGTNTTNYVEVVFRILKDCILNRVMAFNLTQLVDFILTQCEAYMQKRLVDFANGRLPKSLLHKMLPLKNSIPVEDIHVIDSSTHCYQVTSQTNPEKEYFVDIINAVCSCFDEQCGKLCKHASAILLQITPEITTAYNLNCQYTRQRMYYVATGNVVSEDWLMPLRKAEQNTIIEDINSSKEQGKNEDLTGGNVDADQLNNELAESPMKTDKLTDTEQLEFKKLMKDIEDGYKEEPEIFAPAIRKMISNRKKFASTKSGLVSAMHSFGLYHGAGKKISTKKYHGQSIGVQPTAISRRKSFLSGKRKLSAGRPSGSIKRPLELHSHDYTSLGSLPSRKMKSKHDLQDCVYNNKSLGGRK